MADHGPHSAECAQAVSGTCHCDCHGAMHGVAHLPHRKHEPGTTVTAIGSGAYHVVAPGGLPPGGGTHEERVAHHAAKVAVTAHHEPHEATPAAKVTHAATISHEDAFAREGRIQVARDRETAKAHLAGMSTSDMAAMSEHLGRGRITADMTPEQAQENLVRAIRGYHPRRGSEVNIPTPPRSVPRSGRNGLSSEATPREDTPTPAERRLAKLAESTDPKDNGSKVAALLEGGADSRGSASLYRRIVVNNSGHTAPVEVGKVRPNTQWGTAYDLKVHDPRDGSHIGYLTRAVRDGKDGWNVHSVAGDGALKLEGWTDSAAAGADMLHRGEYVAFGRHDSQRTSPALWRPHRPDDRPLAERAGDRAGAVNVVDARHAEPTTPTYDRSTQRLADYGAAAEAHRAARDGSDPFTRARNKFDPLGDYNKIAAYSTERFQALSDEDKAKVTAALTDLLARTRAPEAHARIADTLRRFTGQETAPLVVPPPDHVQAALDAVEGARAPRLPLTYVYGGVTKEQYGAHFTPDQRRRVRETLEKIRANLTTAGPGEREHVDRAIGDLRSIDGLPGGPESTVRYRNYSEASHAIRTLDPIGGGLPDKGAVRSGYRDILGRVDTLLRYGPARVGSKRQFYQPMVRTLTEAIGYLDKYGGSEGEKAKLRGLVAIYKASA